MRRLCFRLTFLILGMVASSACERYKQSYEAPQTVASNGNGIDAKTGAVLNTKTEILLLSSKLLGQEAKYAAIAKFGGVTSARVNLAKADQGAKIDVPGLPSAKSDVLVVEIYEGDKLRFIAKKAKTELAAATSQANTVQVDECLILTAPWDGTTSDGSCDWDIEEAK